MKSEDTAKFKQIAVCNFDFLLAAVSKCVVLFVIVVPLLKVFCLYSIHSINISLVALLVIFRISNSV